MNRQRLVVGLSLIAFPLAVQVPFTLLVERFSYPDILQRSADEVLTRFHAGGSSMVFTWYAYALCTLGLFFVATMFPDVLEQKGPVARLSVASGVIAALSQLFGLLRWTLVVPFLATRWVENPEQHQALEVAYEVQHRLFGVLLGEHVGPLFMAVWTAAASVMLLKANAPRWLSAAGFVSAVLFIGGLGSGLSRAVPMPAFVQPLPMLAFIAWSVWALATGVLLVIRSRVGVPGGRSLKVAAVVATSVIGSGCQSAPTVRRSEPMVIPAEVTERGETVYFGSTFPLKHAGSEPLFVYERRVEQRGEVLVSTHVTREPSTGAVAVAESATHTAGYALQQYTLHANQLGQRGSISVEGEQVTFTLVDESGEHTKVEQQRLPVVIGPTLVGFTLKHLPTLRAKQQVAVRFAVLDRLETIGFELSEVEGAAGQTRIKMAASNFLYALAIDPIFFTFDTATGKLVRLEGRVPPKLRTGDGWADLDARVEYRFVADAYR